MDSSRGFGSTRQYSVALFGLAFAPAPDVFALNLYALPRNSPVHSTKGTPLRRPLGHPALTACRCMVSGSLSFPSRGAFHLSLTVLVHYRSSRVFEPWRVVPPASHWIPRVPWYSRPRFSSQRPSPTGLSPSAARLSRRFGSFIGFLLLPGRDTSRPARLSTPLSQRMPAITRESVWAPPRSLATTWGISVDFFSSGY